MRDSLGEWPEGEYADLHTHLDQTRGYLRRNRHLLVNYARRYFKGLTVSSATAESAVNLAISAPMAKKRQMRWSEEGVHLLAQVRVTFLNGYLRPRIRPAPFKAAVDDDYLEWAEDEILDAA